MSNFGITISRLRQLHHCYLIRYLSVTSLNMVGARALRKYTTIHENTRFTWVHVYLCLTNRVTERYYVIDDRKHQN